MYRSVLGSVTVAAALVAGLTVAGAARADGDAFVVGNSRYSSLQSLFGTARLTAGAQAMRGAGFEVTELDNADTQAMLGGFGKFVRGIDAADAPLVVVMTGAFVHSATGAYLLPVDASRDVDPARVLTRAFPLDAVLSILAERPGRAFLVLGDSADVEISSPYLRTGLGDIPLPQGVTLVTGAAPDVVRYAGRVMARPDRDLAQDAREFGLTLSGYAPRGLAVLRADEVGAATQAIIEEPPQADSADTPLQPDLTEDTNAWQTAQQADSAAGYQRYLQRFANGRHVAAAQQRLNAINAEPFYAERRAEEALELSRDQRREIQQQLRLLGYYDRGIDGLFGRGTRAGVSAWQKSIDRPETGYLNANQVTRLANQARRRADELEAEAEARRAEQARQDRAYWEQLSDRNDAQQLRGYLERFPEGAFAERAQERLRVIEARRAEQAAAQDRRAWQRAREADSVPGYNTYLSENLTGAFREEAVARIADLRRAAVNEGNVAQARAEENALGLNLVARRLAEARLRQIGLDPGEVDGRLDDRARRAIRQYQRSSNIESTGYLDQDTVVRLLSGTIIGR